MPEQRNFILAIVLSLAVVLVWSIIFPPHAPTRHPGPGAPSSTATSAQTAVPAVVAPVVLASRVQAIAAATRVPIAAKSVCGSISLTGARIDDLQFADYFAEPKKRTRDPRPPCGTDNAYGQHVVLLSPLGTDHAYYAEYGWTAPANAAYQVPGPDTVWSLENGTKLTEATPVTLAWTDPQGVTFRLTYAIDDKYMVTVRQEVANQSSTPLTLMPFGRIVRQEIPNGRTYMVLTEGFIGWIGDDLRERAWKSILKSGTENYQHSVKGWFGLADKYWLAALAPPQTEPFDAQNGVETLPGGPGTTAMFTLAPRNVAPGANARIDSHFFAGAREVDTINKYNDAYGIKEFDQAIDWGRFIWVLTKPIYFLLEHLSKFVASIGITFSFGVAILLCTVIIKLLLFPLANRSFETMGKMKKLQPQLKEMQERYKDDKVELQKQMMALYSKEKVNPLAGCLPVFVQIPVFFSLYKVIFTTIEMRQAPFVGWIHDLSSRDPTAVLQSLRGLPVARPRLHADALGRSCPRTNARGRPRPPDRRRVADRHGDDDVPADTA